MAEPDFELIWNIEALSCALDIEQEDVKDYVQHGGRVGFIEMKVMKQLGGKLSGENDYDLVDPNGLKWEIRCITKQANFGPSGGVGVDRAFSESKFLKKLENVDGYILADIKDPDYLKVRCWKVSKKQVEAWWEETRLNTKASLCRNKILKMLESSPNLYE